MALLNETELARRTDEEVVRPPWIAGLAGGLVGGAAMGVAANMMLLELLTESIPGLVGLEGLGTGWIVHLGIAAVFGVGYAALAAETGFADRSTSVGWDVALGLAYGVVLWTAGMSIAMPLWLEAIGTTALPFPWFDTTTLLGHLLSGMVVGVVFPLVEFE